MISYSAANATGTVVPSTISWTPISAGATQYAYTMAFAYGINTPESSIEAYVAGTAVSDTNLLQSISISYNTSLVKEYFLNYGKSPNTNKEDVNGNVSSRQGSTIGWSSYNYPTQINDTAVGESVSFAYGPDRQAWETVTQTSGGTEQAYHVGGLLDIVKSGTVTDYRHYIYAGGEPVAVDSRKSSGVKAFYYLLSDHQGSVASITNGSGGVVVNESFTAFGNRRNPTTWSGSASSANLNTIAGITRHGYTFQEALGSGMALNDMIGRVQDPVVGRFLSADPYVTAPENTQNWNPYSYVYNNPLTYVDPSGFGCSLLTFSQPIWTQITGPFGDSTWTGDITTSFTSCSADDIRPGGGPGREPQGGPAGQGASSAADQARAGTSLRQTDSCSTPGVYVCLPPKPDCSSALPNGSTVGGNVQQVDSNIDQTEISVAEAGGDPSAAGFGVYLASVGSNGPLDFKNNFRGQADAGFLGQAGNFAFGAVSAHLFGSGSFGQYIALSGAGVYAIGAGKKGAGIPFLVPPYGADSSAQANTPAGVASSCAAPRQ